MSQGLSHGDEQYPAGDPYAQYPAEQLSGGQKAASKVSIPTILASAGVAAVVSALIVTIGVVGLVISNDNNNNSSMQQPTVVNLGAAQNPGAQSGTAPVAGNAAPQAGTTTPPAAAPAPAAVEQVPESGGDAGAGTGTAGVTQSAAPQPQAPAQTQQQPAVAAPAALTAGQLNTKVKIIMNTGASRAARGDELQAGERALGSVDAVAEMLRVSGAGFTYKMIDPVSLNGTNLSAPLQMSLVGNGSRNLQLTWVWVDGKWKLSNTSVCDIASYAMLPCTV